MMPDTTTLRKYHTGEQLQNLGQNLYRAQKYNEALEVFNEARALLGVLGAIADGLEGCRVRS